MIAPHRSRDQVLLVASRELRTRLGSKAWRISTALMVVLVVGLVLVGKLADHRSEVGVGLLPDAVSVGPALISTGESLGTTVATTPVADEQLARSMVADGQLDAAVRMVDGTLSVTVKKEIDPGLESALRVLARQLVIQQQIVALGGDPASFSSAVAGAEVGIVRLSPPATYTDQTLTLGVIAGILVFVALQLNGQMLAQGVVEEKSTRVVELLLAAVRPWELMAGKVLGLGLVGLAQLGLIAGAGLGGGVALGTLDLSVGEATGMLAWAALWFVLGFVAYALALAAAAALVSRQEEVQNVMLPVLAPLLVAYLVGVTVLPSNPDSGVGRVLSLLPPFAPAMMPIRIGMGTVPAWQAALAVAGMLLTIPVLAWLAGRIYRNAVVRSGARVRLGDALRRR